MRRTGFTLIELLIGTVIMSVIILGALFLYSRSIKISADQQQYVELQNDVRAAAFFIARDVRMAGTGIPPAFAGYVLQGVDNEAGANGITPDRLRIMGNIEDPLILSITSYSSSSSTATVADYSFEKAGYPDSFYQNRIVLLFPKSSSSCVGLSVCQISQVQHTNPGPNEGFTFSPGQVSGVNPPGGLSNVCADSAYYTGGYLLFADVNEYWLDVTGNAAGLTAGVNGYIGGGAGGVLYATKDGVYYPLAQNIETLQFQYNGDFNADGQMDGFTDWNPAWTTTQIAAIRQVRIIVVGRTRDPFAAVNKLPVSGLYLYRRPPAANTAAGTSDDWHKRFLLETTSTLRNASLNIYNTGGR
ncbi:MAG: prepilin-type N-terminal cleavage/methylation domain-containing protein [Candidatus Aminicenantales bacterium]|jgi:prepilin-type N-terminal cleavage/methylation domain-containing protein